MLLSDSTKEKIEQHVRHVRECWQACQNNEAATKSAPIVPLLTCLGYNLADPAECMPEYKADFGEGRSVKPVDWALCIEGHLAFLIEAKAVGKEIRAYDEQLGDYFAKGQPGVVLGILTNGVCWRFFSDVVDEHVMDKKPFLEWDVLGDGPIPFYFLTILQRTEFKPESIKTFAKEKRRQSVLVTELARLLENSEEFVKFVLQNTQLESRNLSTKVVQEWKPILAGALQEWVKHQRLKVAMGDGANDAAPPQTAETAAPAGN